MRRAQWTAAAIAVVCIAIAGLVILSQRGWEPQAQPSSPDTILLPEPQRSGAMSLEQALAERRSVRDYKDEPLTLAEVGQLLWAAQGVTDPAGFRTAPSAGALYPLEIFVVVGNVDSLPPGAYRYDPGRHALIRTAEGDRRNALAGAALGQSSIRDGAVVVVFAAVYERITEKYGERGIRYVHMEAGHASQNVYLQAVSLGLGTVTIGAFYDDRVKDVVGFKDDEVPLYLMPVGKR
jgi:SagB-type dehydrogenase family enzyme